MNTPIRILVLMPLVALAAGLTGCVQSANWGTGWRTVTGSGNIVTETRSVSGFDSVHISGVGEMTLTQGDRESLTIEADDNVLPLIRSEISNGQLRIGPDNVSIRSATPIRYRLAFKQLRALHLSGAVRVQADNIKTDRLALRISGSGAVSIPALETRSLSSQISGSGRTTVAGHADKQEIRISGSGDHRARDLRSTQAEVNISGSGNASLWVDEILNAHISGSGKVEYRGAAAVESHVSGSGRITRRAGME